MSPPYLLSASHRSLCSHVRVGPSRFDRQEYASLTSLRVTPTRIVFHGFRERRLTAHPPHLWACRSLGGHVQSSACVTSALSSDQWVRESPRAHLGGRPSGGRGLVTGRPGRGVSIARIVVPPAPGWPATRSFALAWRSLFLSSGCCEM